MNSIKKTVFLNSVLKTVFLNPIKKTVISENASSHASLLLPTIPRCFQNKKAGATNRKKISSQTCT